MNYTKLYNYISSNMNSRQPTVYSIRGIFKSELRSLAKMWYADLSKYWRSTGYANHQSLLEIENKLGSKAIENLPYLNIKRRVNADTMLMYWAMRVGNDLGKYYALRLPDFGFSECHESEHEGIKNMVRDAILHNFSEDVYYLLNGTVVFDTDVSKYWKVIERRKCSKTIQERDKAIVLLMVCFGLYPSQIEKLLISDVDLLHDTNVIPDTDVTAKQWLLAYRDSLPLGFDNLINSFNDNGLMNNQALNKKSIKKAFNKSNPVLIKGKLRSPNPTYIRRGYALYRRYVLLHSVDDIARDLGITPRALFSLMDIKSNLSA